MRERHRARRPEENSNKINSIESEKARRAEKGINQEGIEVRTEGYEKDDKRVRDRNRERRRERDRELLAEGHVRRITLL